MTDKITLELTLDELKLIDKYVELNDETQSVFDKINVVYPQPKMTLANSGEYAVVSYNDTTYYRFMGEDATCFSWYMKIDYSVQSTLVMVIDDETERLLEGLYYNHIVVKKETAQERGERVHNEMEETIKIHDGYGVVDYKPTPKTPVEECYKDWWGEYPPTGPSVDGIDDIRWRAFQMGYNASKEEKVKMSESLHAGYYLAQKEKAQERGERVHNEMEELVRESVKWCEDHPNENPLDYLTPKTPEETEQSLKEAFREAQQTEKWKEIQKLIDEEDNDKNFKNSLDLIKEWGEKNKPPTLKELLWEWWEDIFTVDSDLDADASIDVLVDRIDKEFIPPSSEKNGCEWEKCLKIMRDKLR